MDVLINLKEEESNIPVSDFSSGKKRVIIYTKDERVFKSEWFSDGSEKSDTCINCTKKELKYKKALMAMNNLTSYDVRNWYISRYREEETFYITKHAFDRLKERNGWNKKTIKRMVEKIYNTGTEVKDVKSKPWLTSITKKISNRPVFYKIYGQFIYIFDCKTLVTVLHMPKNVKALG